MSTFKWFPKSLFLVIWFESSCSLVGVVPVACDRWGLVRIPSFCLRLSCPNCEKSFYPKSSTCLFLLKFGLGWVCSYCTL